MKHLVSFRAERNIPKYFRRTLIYSNGIPQVRVRCRRNRYIGFHQSICIHFRSLNTPNTHARSQRDKVIPKRETTRLFLLVLFGRLSRAFERSHKNQFVYFRFPISFAHADFENRLDIPIEQLFWISYIFICFLVCKACNSTQKWLPWNYLTQVNHSRSISLSSSIVFLDGNHLCSNFFLFLCRMTNRQKFASSKVRLRCRRSHQRNQCLPLKSWT